VPKHFIELEDVEHGVTAHKDRQKVVVEIHNWLKAL
jgi:hypothetical protein